MSLTRATYSSLAAALVINVLAVSLARLSGFSVALGDAASVLAGSDSSDVLKAVWCALNTAPWPYLAYFALTWGGAVIAARCWYCLMDIQGWEHIDSCMQRVVRGHAPWFYLLRGYDYQGPGEVEGAFVAATVDMGGVTYLYEGLLLDYQLGEDGVLDRLVLVEAARRLLSDDRLGSAGDNERFYEISGHCFTIKYAQINTLNVSYLVNAEPDLPMT